MSEQLIHIRIFLKPVIHDVWINDLYVINDFINDVKKTWLKYHAHYNHFFYHVEQKRVLDGTKTFKENQVIQSDHLILF